VKVAELLTYRQVLRLVNIQSIFILGPVDVKVSEMCARIEVIFSFANPRRFSRVMI
jgi:hypothetical protein